MSQKMESILNKFKIGAKEFYFYSLPKLEQTGFGSVHQLPFSIKVLLENLLRHETSSFVTETQIRALANWNPKQPALTEIPLMPARAILQDFTGIPCMLDLAMLRQKAKQLGKDIGKINPVIPVDLVVDHSIQVDFFRTPNAIEKNLDMEYQRNQERYTFLHWAQTAYGNFRVVPPGHGIVHQVNLEYLARVVQTQEKDGLIYAFPDTVLGTDSHTPMVNGLGVLGWGIGGIEAEACMLGQPFFMTIPQVIGVKLVGEFIEGVTATDLVLTITQLLRNYGVVGKFVEFFGPGLSRLSLADRATIANMSPEYGAMMSFFPVDNETLRYMQATNRPSELLQLVEEYTKAQGLFRAEESPDPTFTHILTVDLKSIEPCVAGPKRPSERLPLQKVRKALQAELGPDIKPKKVNVQMYGKENPLADGSVVIAAITSCTNTSNPAVMLAAGLLAKKAVERGLHVSPTVKTSLAPGSMVVTDYLKNSGVLNDLDKLGFQIVGYGCTTCIGNSGPLPEPVANAIRENNLTVASVLSGNRNFEGRIHPLASMAFLTSPPLVVAYALAGTIDIDLLQEPLGYDIQKKPVYLRDIWPSPTEIDHLMKLNLTQELFQKHYENIFLGNAHWKSLSPPTGSIYQTESDSTYILNPPFLENFSWKPEPVRDIHHAYMLALLGDHVTTDHISPAGSIPENSPAGEYLIARGIQPKQFNTYGTRRGNHEVMIRGTFGNIRLKNHMVPDKIGGWTVHVPTGKVMRIYEAAMQYKNDRTPLVVLAGKEYGAGSSRDWAAKGAMLLGVKAVIAESFERIHRSNLICMNVLPLQFEPGQSWSSLGLTGREKIDVQGITNLAKPGEKLEVVVTHSDGKQTRFNVVARFDSPTEIEYYRHGGILPFLFRRLFHA